MLRSECDFWLFALMISWRRVMLNPDGGLMEELCLSGCDGCSQPAVTSAFQISGSDNYRVKLEIYEQTAEHLRVWWEFDEQFIHWNRIIHRNLAVRCWETVGRDADVSLILQHLLFFPSPVCYLIKSSITVHYGEFQLLCSFCTWAFFFPQQKVSPGLQSVSIA